MAQHDFEIANQSGLNFRQDLNNALSAIVSNNSGSTEPEVPFAYQWWVDTSGANPILKQRNAANSGWVIVGRTDLANFGIGPTGVGVTAPSSPLGGQFWIDTSGTYPILNIRNSGNTAWVVLGRLDQPNLGLLPLTGGTVTGAVNFSNTDYLKLPSGSSAQRPVSPAAGQIRFNSDLTQFEGYTGTAWSPVGGGGYSVATLEALTDGASVSTSTLDQRQLRRIQGSGAAVTLSSTPFGTAGGWRDGTEVLLVGNDDTNTVTLNFNDAAKGVVGNFESIEIVKYLTVNLVYSSALDRWLVKGVY